MVFIIIAIMYVQTNALCILVCVGYVWRGSCNSVDMWTIRGYNL